VSKQKKLPFHEKIKMLIIRSTVGITSDIREAKAGELLVLFGLLEESVMPVKAAHELASLFATWPKTLEEAGQRELAQVVRKVLEDLRTREDVPSSPDGTRELSRKLFYLGEHIGILESWSRRGDMDSDVAESIRLTRQVFDEAAKILPPQA